jgi:hypothetical protein
MRIAPDQEFTGIAFELVKAMRAAGYSPSQALEVLIAAIIITRRESSFSDDIEEAAEAIQRAIIVMDPHIHVVSAQ